MKMLFAMVAALATTSAAFGCDVGVAAVNSYVAPQAFVAPAAVAYAQPVQVQSFAVNAYAAPPKVVQVQSFAVQSAYPVAVQNVAVQSYGQVASVQAVQVKQAKVRSRSRSVTRSR